MSSIIDNEYLSAEFNMTVYPSFIDGATPIRAAYQAWKLAVFSLGKVPDYDIYHIHVCTGASTWRKMHYVKKLGPRSNRVVLHVHGAFYHTFFDNCNEQQQRKIREFFGAVGLVVVLSEEWRDCFLERSICPKSKIKVLHNAVYLPMTNKTDYAQNSVLFLGRYGERKSPDVLIRAAAVVVREHPDAIFIFAGDGNMAPYRRLAFKLGVFESCRFYGWVEGYDKERLFERSSLFCLPSRGEGLPMSAVEAMAHGLVTIATPVGGIPSLISEGENGFLIQVGNSEGLAELLTGLMGDIGTKKRIGEAGRVRVAEGFNMDAYAVKLADLYHEIIH